MNHERIRVKPQSIVGINHVCEEYLKTIGLMPKFPSCIDVELLLDGLNDTYGVRHRLVTHLESGAEAEYDALKGHIYIPCSSFEQAIDGNSHHRFTIAHEVGHVILHKEQLLSRQYTLHRTMIKAYEDSEWQADTAAGCLLAPLSLCETLFRVQEKKDQIDFQMFEHRIQTRFGLSKSSAARKVQQIKENPMIIGRLKQE